MQKRTDPWPFHIRVEEWRTIVDKLIALAYDLASTELQRLLACRQCDPLKVSTTRLPPLPTLHLLLRECMEWFWTDGDSF